MKNNEDGRHVNNIKDMNKKIKQIKFKERC